LYFLDFSKIFSFHAFHADSKLAYSWLRELRAKQTTVDSLEENGVLHDLTNGEQKDENEEKVIFLKDKF